MIKFIVSCFILLGTIANAQENPLGISLFGTLLHSEKVPNALFLFADIEPGDSFELRRALREHEIDTIVLASNGGSVREGLTMAGMIFDKKMATYVPDLPDNKGCYSACAFIFFAGHNRLADGQLAVHQFATYDSETDNQRRNLGETQQSTQFTASEVIGFLNEFETPPWVYERMFRSRELYYFSEVEKLDLSTGILNISAKASIDSFLLLLLEELAKYNQVEDSFSDIFSMNTNDKVQVRTLQTLLNAAQCSAGAVDGTWGRKTNSAAARFAKENSFNYFGPASISEEYIRLLASKEYKKCPPPPKPKRVELPQNWSFNLICVKGEVKGFATITLQSAEATASIYRVAYSNSLGQNYSGRAYQTGRSFSFELQQTNGQNTSIGSGGISNDWKLVRGTTSEGCDFVAAAR